MKLYRLQVYNSMIHHLYVASCAYHPVKSLSFTINLAPSPFTFSMSLASSPRWILRTLGPWRVAESHSRRRLVSKTARGGKPQAHLGKLLHEQEINCYDKPLRVLGLLQQLTLP